MNGSCGICSTAGRRGERGEARLKFLITIAVIGVIAYMGYQYVPVAIQAYQFKDFMQQTVDKASALGKSSEWAKDQLMASRKDYGVPPDAAITTTLRDRRMEARVQFTRPVPLPFYTYQYNFDHTVTSVDLMSVK